MDSNGALRNLESQIESCRQLLSVFQEERGVYNQGRALTKEELSGILERKTRLVQLFENQRSLLKDLEKGANDFPEELKSKRKTLFRALAGLLEQLIVIDQENERLMREAACTTRRQPLNPFASRQRPSLQMQLPLMPFGPAPVQAAKAPEAPAAAKPAMKISQPEPVKAVAPAAPAPARQTLREFKAPSVGAGVLPIRPKSHLRVYGASASSAALSHG